MKKGLAIAAIVIVGAIVGFALSPYLTESTVDESLPEGVVIPNQMETTEVMDLTEMSMDELVAISEEKGIELDELVAMSTPDDIKDDATADDLQVDGMTEAQMAEMEMVSATHYAGTFIGVNDGIHNANGNAYAIPLDDGSTLLRLENFVATNGPDLHVYLATDKRATDYVDLGELKANRGNQNYGIPEGTDLGTYDHVLIWCEPFRVLFGSAELLPQ